MKQFIHRGCKPLLVIFAFLSICIFSRAQSGLDWKKDTISKTDANGAKSSYGNLIRANGKSNVTERVVLPVSKLKSVMDACAANNISDVSVLIVAIRPGADVARYKKNHPEAAAYADKDIEWKQLLVFKVPRRAFSGMSSKAKISSHPLMISLASLGLVTIDQGYGLPDSADDLYLEFGTICPPPLSCD